MSEYIITTEQLNFFTSYMPDDAMIPAKMAHLQPLVRCRECKWRAGQNRHAVHPNMCLFFSCDTEPDGFCKWGVRA